jgi:transcriptional regulator with GAF, ATPase, and Fis domain
MKPAMKERINDITLRIFNSTDLEKSLREIFDFLQKSFPVDLINLPICDPNKGVLRYMAIVTDDRTLLIDETIKLSDRGRKYINDLALAEVIIWNDSRENKLMQEVSAHMDVQDVTSTMALTTEMGRDKTGAIGLVAWGHNRYTEVHRREFTAMFEPLAAVVRHILSQLEIRSLNELLVIENKDLKKRLGYLSGSRIVGENSGLRSAMDQVDQVAPLDSPVLLIGETGVGKEVLANAIHRRSSRADGPLVSLNCGAIPDTLLDSELFGHEKGAFTGANTLKRGYFEQANSGTVFLDEIGELALQAQVKLLRMIQTMEFQRVGGSRTISIDVRVIAATNRDLRGMVKNQQFRKDLWFRLSVFPIRIPPLRERKQDIPDLAEYFVRRKSMEMNLPRRPAFAPEAMEQLMAYDWPGNVRELQNVIERALIVSRGKPLSFANLTGLAVEKAEDYSSNHPDGFLTMDEMTALHIRRSLMLSKGRVEGQGGAAEMLGMNPSTLRGRMRKLGIRIERHPN